MLDLTGAGGGDQLGKRLTADPSEGKVNDIGVAEEVI
jgi:hypothetical protein